MGISGLIAIVGGLAGNFLTYKLTTSHGKQSLRLNKLEHLAALTHEFEQWLAKERSATLARTCASGSPSTVNHINTIIRIYFPEMQDAVRDLVKTAEHYNVWRSEGESHMTASHNGTVDHAVREAYSEKHQYFLLKMMESKISIEKKSAQIMQSLLRYV